MSFKLTNKFDKLYAIVRLYYPYMYKTGSENADQNVRSSHSGNLDTKSVHLSLVPLSLCGYDYNLFLRAVLEKYHLRIRETKQFNERSSTNITEQVLYHLTLTLISPEISESQNIKCQSPACRRDDWYSWRPVRHHVCTGQAS